MMNKFTNPLLVVAMMVSSGMVAAKTECNPGDGPYISIGVGASKIQSWKNIPRQADVHYKTNAIYRLAIGSQFSVFRAEFEPSLIRTKHHQGASRGHVQLVSTMGNLYWGLPFEGKFTTYPIAPFVGAGIGFSSLRTSILGTEAQTTGRSHNTVLSYQGIAGVRLALDEQVGLNLEYRYFSTEKLNFVGKRIESHSANIGLTFRF